MDLLALVGIVTISDRAFRGEYEDLSGPAMLAAVKEYLVCQSLYEMPRCRVSRGAGLYRPVERPKAGN